MGDAQIIGCEEFVRLSRRGFIGIAGAAAASAMLPRVAMARDYRTSQRDVVVTIFLRGGADGLTLCAPWGEAAYYAARPSIAVPRPDSSVLNRGINLDGFFAFPAALAPFVPIFQEGRLLVVHAAGSTDPTRSHFLAQSIVETARGQANVSTGWLGRHLESVAPMVPNAALRGVGLSYAGMQQALIGGPRSVPVPPTVASAGFSGVMNDVPFANGVEAMYSGAREPLRTTALDTIEMVAALRGVNFNGYQPATGSNYPTGALSTTLKQVAALIKAQIGVEAVTMDAPGGWDTHADQGPLTGEMAGLMNSTAAAIAAFYRDMNAGGAPSTTIVVMSEFGRALRENSSRGSDHGRGGVMFVIGPAVNGGRVLTQWPGLAPNQLHEGRDLKVTIDYRDILAEIVDKRLGNPNVSYVFPGYTPVRRGVFLG